MDACQTGKYILGGNDDAALCRRAVLIERERWMKTEWMPMANLEVVHLE